MTFRCIQSFRAASAAVGVAMAGLALSPSAQALDIVPIFGVGVSSQAQTAFNYAAAEFTTHYTDAVTVTINVVAGNTGLGGSSTPLLGVVDYTFIRNALAADQAAHPSTDGATSLAAGGSVGSTTDPMSAGTGYLVTRAQAKALNLIANDSISDGTFTYNASLSYSFDPNHRGSTGAYDFIGVAEHEISEIMGRITVNGEVLVSSPNYLPYDLFNFSAPGVHSSAQSGGRYYSIDNGTTNLHGYNNAVLNGGDPQDWDSTLATDPYNAFTGTGQGHVLNAVDYSTLDVIGWDRAAAPVPEPGSWAMMVAGIAALGAAVRRRTGR